MGHSVILLLFTISVAQNVDANGRIRNTQDGLEFSGKAFTFRCPTLAEDGSIACLGDQVTSASGSCVPVAPLCTGPDVEVRNGICRSKIVSDVGQVNISSLYVDGVNIGRAISDLETAGTTYATTASLAAYATKDSAATKTELSKCVTADELDAELSSFASAKVRSANVNTTVIHHFKTKFWLTL